MILRRTIILIFLSYYTVSGTKLFSFDRLRSYARYIDLYALGWNSTGNELWNGIINDCSRKMSFSCIQKNAYTYLDNTFVERDNITVFNGLVLRKNSLDYEAMFKQSNDSHNVAENLVEDSGDHNQSNDRLESKIDPESDEDEVNEPLTPLEEITGALRDKAVKFLSTRDYELQLPDYIFEGSTVKISPREIDEKGALIRVDFSQQEVETQQGRLFFKKIKKFIKSKLLLSFFALILLIKLIKVKFFFVIPFLFGVGAAKKLFLKVLLFLVPAFANVFKLCSSYYSSQANRYHHHHHQVAHHHHHVPVPVPVPSYYSSHSPHSDDHEGYDYPAPQMQLRKDLAELKEWGIGDDQTRNDDISSIIAGSIPIAPSYAANPYGPPPPPTDSYGPPPSNTYGPPPTNSYGPPPLTNTYGAPPARSSHAQSLAYSGQVDDHGKFNRRTSVQSAASTIAQVSQIPSGPINIQLPGLSTVNVVTPGLPNPVAKNSAKTTFNVFAQPGKMNSAPITVREMARPVQSQMASNVSPGVASSSSNQVSTYDDSVYGPILQKLDDIFSQMRFVEENCRERLVCSMYKNPTIYSPHSNLVSNELSRDPQELKHGNSGSGSSVRFHRYVAAARIGQDGGDCLRMYPCSINTE